MDIDSIKRGERAKVVCIGYSADNEAVPGIVYGVAVNKLECHIFPAKVINRGCDKETAVVH